MKTKLISYLLPLCLLTALATALLDGETDAATQGSNTEFMLEVFTQKESFLPGELIELKFKVTNTSAATVTLAQTDVYRGNLTVLVAYENGAFRKYRGPRWGLADYAFERLFTLEPNGVYETDATLLFNHVRPTKHLSSMHAERINGENLDSDYALDRPGRYFIKAVIRRSEKEDPIESAAVALDILEPQGVDLEVWERMKDDPEIGYLLQTGRNRHHPDDPRIKRATETLEQIAQEHPDSSYAEAINSKLNTFRDSVERLKEKGLLREQ